MRQLWERYWGRSPEDERHAGWLAPFVERLAHSTGPVLELGCGGGVDTEALCAAGLEVVAADYARAAMAGVARRAPLARRVLCDLRDGLPFGSASVGAVVAGLSLHYFDAATTDGVVAEVARCLRPGGVLLARVNSVKDLHYGAADGRELEHHLREVRGRPKRFFDRADVDRFFGRALTLERFEETTVGIVPEKHVWLLLARAGNLPPHRVVPATGG